MEKVRIQKLLSALKVCSRRQAERYLVEGRIKVNSEVITELGFMVSQEDTIQLDDKVVSGKIKEEHIYLKVNKPYDVVSTLSDPQGRKTIKDILPSKYGRLYPVGRLDHNSTGLMIMTDDGEFANLVTHPSSSPEKEYLVKVKNRLDGTEIDKLEKGVYVPLDGYTSLPMKVEIVEQRDDSAILLLTLIEGKKREIRHVMDALDHPVSMLTRIRIGNILLGSLKEGQYQEIDKNLIDELKDSCKKKKGIIDE